MSDFELAKGRVLHFNEDSWNRLQEVLAEKRLHLMAEHVAEQRKKDVVVLDLDAITAHLGRRDVGEVLQALRHKKDPAAFFISNSRIADAIEAQTKPPRIPEPGRYAVVEAEADDAGRRLFCRLEDDAEGWSGAGNWYRWSDLVDPTLVRPGVEDDQ